MTDTNQIRDHLRNEAIRLLTQAARQTSDRGETLDFADFLTSALVATAANVGGPDRLLAGHPRSWEASHLADLLRSAADWDRSAWTSRTERLLVPLNVAELVEDRDLHPGLVTLDDAIELVDRRYKGMKDTDPACEAWILEVEALSERYEKEYQRYAGRFAFAAQVLGRALVPPVEVRVIADTSPSPRWWDDTAVTNPMAGDADPLAFAIWRIAHDTVALPNVDVLSAGWRDGMATPDDFRSQHASDDRSA